MKIIEMLMRRKIAFFIIVIIIIIIISSSSSGSSKSSGFTRGISSFIQRKTMSLGYTVLFLYIRIYEVCDQCPVRLFSAVLYFSPGLLLRYILNEFGMVLFSPYYFWYHSSFLHITYAVFLL